MDNLPPFLNVLIFSARPQTGFSCNVSEPRLPARNFLPLSDTQHLFLYPPVHRFPPHTSFPDHSFYSGIFRFSPITLFLLPGLAGNRIPAGNRSPADHSGHIPAPDFSPAIEPPVHSPQLYPSRGNTDAPVGGRHNYHCHSWLFFRSTGELIDENKKRKS